MKDYKAMWGALNQLARDELGSAQARVLTATPETFLQSQGRWLQMQWLIETLHDINTQASAGALPEEEDNG